MPNDVRWQLNTQPLGPVSLILKFILAIRRFQVLHDAVFPHIGIAGDYYRFPHPFRRTSLERI